MTSVKHRAILRTIGVPVKSVEAKKDSDNAIRPGRQFRNVRKSLKPEHLFGVALATLEELGLFQSQELKLYVRDYEHYRCVTNMRSKDQSVRRDILENWMEWVCMILEIYLECAKRLREWRHQHADELRKVDESEELTSRVAAAQLAKARNLLRKSLVKHLKSLSKKFTTDRTVDYTVLDMYLRIGAVNEFDAFISALVLRYPTDVTYWYLAIRRRIAEGDYLNSLLLCQKGLRYNPKDLELDHCLRRLVFVVAAINAATPQSDENDLSSPARFMPSTSSSSDLSE